MKTEQDLKRTPNNHKAHKDDVPCGCWTGQEEETTNCPICGATYLLSEVMSFPRWRCYDCRGGWWTVDPRIYRNLSTK